MGNACKQVFVLCAVAMLAAACATGPVKETGDLSGKASFQRFYKQLRQEVVSLGLDAEALDAAFGGSPQPIPSVAQAEKQQPEIKRTFAEYVGPMLSEERISKGLEHMATHRAALEQITSDTGVPAGTIVALWGIETNFGVRQGETPIIPALVTLAWSSPRGDYFRREVFAALRVLKKAELEPRDLKGSWAGAMGQCQFMPSSYLAYARDGDGDGKADIWNSEDDVFASAATFLKAKGWHRGQPWRVQLAALPDVTGTRVNARGLSDPMPLSAWKKRGAKLAPGQDESAFTSSTPMRYYEPQPGGPAYLLGPNFSTVLRWNNSSYFAWSVLTLADLLQAESRI